MVRGAKVAQDKAAAGAVFCHAFGRAARCNCTALDHFAVGKNRIAVVIFLCILPLDDIGSAGVLCAGRLAAGISHFAFVTGRRIRLLRAGRCRQ